MEPQKAFLANPLHAQYIPNGRGYDYSLHAVKEHLALPANVQFFQRQVPALSAVRIVRIEGSAPFIQGIGQTSTLYWKAMKLTDQVWSEREYVQAYQRAGEQALVRRLEHAPYVLLHIRAPDDNTYFHPAFLDPRHSFCTRRVMRRLLRQGLHVKVVSNNHTYTSSLLRGLPSMEVVHRGSYLTDLSHITGAVGIVQQAVEGWSAFSCIPAMALSIPLLNTYMGEDHRYNYFAQYGSIPAEFHACHQLDAFIDRLGLG
jgi:hypothetical protein